MALYRKYRPATFGEVVGQEHVTGPLSVALDTGRINHAYLFSGPRGCGKTSSARILARSLNCEQGPTSTPCGVCNSCRSLAPGGPGNLDVTELDAASHNGVEDMRDLRDRAFFAPAESRYRVFIIDEAHMISTAGSNALLKIVEEPPEHLVFIFATTEPERVIGTIRSRTHHYPFRLLTPSAMRGLLERTCATEGIYVEDAVFPLVIRAGGGSPRDSLSVLDQLLSGAGPDGLTYDLAVPLLGVTDDTLIDAAVDALATNDGGGLFVTVDNVIEAGLDPRRFTTDLLDRLRDLMVLQSVPDALALGLIDVPADRVPVLTGQAKQFPVGVLSTLAALVNDGLTDMRGATSPRLLLEILCARMLMGQPATQTEAAFISPTSSAPATPSAPPKRVFERKSQRTVRERSEQSAPALTPALTPDKPEAKVEAPVPQPQPAQQPVPQSPPTQVPQPKEQVHQKVEEQPIDRIRRKWARVREVVGIENKVAEIMLTEAKALGIRDRTLIIGHNTGALAARLNDPRNNGTIINVLKTELGYDLRVHCVVGTDLQSAGFSPDADKPEWNPDKPAPRPQQVLREQATPPAPQVLAPQPEPTETPQQPTSVWNEPAKLGGSSEESQHSDERAAPAVAPSSRYPAAHSPKPAVEEPRKPKRWEEAVARGNERLKNNPTFSDGVPLPPEPDDPYDLPPEEEVPSPPPPASPLESAPEPSTSGSPQVSAREQEEADMVRQASSEPGSHDHRDARAVAMEMLERELGARPL
ncbi:DNA polymerase III subunit gamma and tau [Corynebacterium freiburgense]|uniref:DNA polymerase III subunit gamma and tau n=1 Tax=Corynebacterium freiburgense TaxID=556548 RepID=UPI00040E2C3E|nr:DNA polymerase III subunit gamma and tau [Corynebacterium freiburgense]WJZ01423.1 DNA polymerase III subunit tau [Corynebacterium freiburgense]